MATTTQVGSSSPASATNGAGSSSSSPVAIPAELARKRRVRKSLSLEALTSTVGAADDEDDASATSSPPSQPQPLSPRSCVAVLPEPVSPSLLKGTSSSSSSSLSKKKSSSKSSSSSSSSRKRTSNGTSPDEHAKSSSSSSSGSTKKSKSSSSKSSSRSNLANGNGHASSSADAGDTPPAKAGEGHHRRANSLDGPLDVVSHSPPESTPPMLGRPSQSIAGITRKSRHTTLQSPSAAATAGASSSPSASSPSRTSVDGFRSANGTVFSQPNLIAPSLVAAVSGMSNHGYRHSVAVAPRRQAPAAVAAPASESIQADSKLSTRAIQAMKALEEEERKAQQRQRERQWEKLRRELEKSGSASAASGPIAVPLVAPTSNAVPPAAATAAISSSPTAAAAAIPPGAVSMNVVTRATQRKMHRMSLAVLPAPVSTATTTTTTSSTSSSSPVAASKSSSSITHQNGHVAFATSSADSPVRAIKRFATDSAITDSFDAVAEEDLTASDGSSGTLPLSLSRDASAPSALSSPSATPYLSELFSPATDMGELGDSTLLDDVETDSNMAAVSKLKHFQEFRRLLQVGFGEFEGRYMDLLTGLLLVATFHTSTFSRTNNVIHDPEKHQELRHWMKWAAAAYGNMLGYLKMRKKFLQYWIGAEGAQLQKIAPLRGDRAVVHDHLQLSDDDFVTGCWAYAELGHMPGYFIGIDHSTKNVVLSLRGSSNHNDALTDLAGKYVPFLDGYVHNGMLYSARLLKEKLTPTIFEQLDKYPGYGFVVCGHSLGAGVTGLFTLLFNSEHPDVPIRGYAFASPATMSANLSVACADFITTVVLGDDLVPRLSFGSIEDLKQTMHHFLANTGTNRARILQIVKHHMGLGEGAAKQLCSLFLCRADETQRVLSTSSNTPHLRERTTKLYPPGTIYHILKNARKELELELSTYDRFGDIIISPAMFKDHMPNNYEKALKALVCPEERKARQFAKLSSYVPSYLWTAPTLGITVTRNPLLMPMNAGLLAALLARGGITPLTAKDLRPHLPPNPQSRANPATKALLDQLAAAQAAHAAAAAQAAAAAKEALAASDALAASANIPRSRSQRFDDLQDSSGKKSKKKHRRSNTVDALLDPEDEHAVPIDLESSAGSLPTSTSTSISSAGPRTINLPSSHLASRSQLSALSLSLSNHPARQARVTHSPRVKQPWVVSPTTVTWRESTGGLSISSDGIATDNVGQLEQVIAAQQIELDRSQKIEAELRAAANSLQQQVCDLLKAQNERLNKVIEEQRREIQESHARQNELKTQVSELMAQVAQLKQQQKR